MAAQQAIPLVHAWKADQWDWPMQHNDGVVNINNTHDKFEVGLDCQFFTPKEVEVKLLGRKVVLHCLHELRSDENGGGIKREVHRTYQLPDDVDTSTLKSAMNARGVLTITANKLASK